MSKNIQQGDSLRCGYTFWLFCQSWCCRLTRLIVLLRLLQNITTHLLLHLAEQISRLGPIHSTWYVTNSSLLSYRPLCVYTVPDGRELCPLKLRITNIVFAWSCLDTWQWGCGWHMPIPIGVVKQMQFISIPVWVCNAKIMNASAAVNCSSLSVVPALLPVQ